MTASVEHAQPTKFALGLDLLEKVVVVTLLGTLASRLIPSAIETGHYQNWFILLAEGCVVFFVLFRRATNNISLRPLDWALGFGGTLAPMLVIASSDTPLVPLALCSFLIVGGMLFQVYAKFTLRRSFGVIAANRGVKVSGPYRFMRHPMYAGYAITHLGFLLSGPNYWNFAVYTLALTLNISRILAEERVLLADPAYQEFSQKVRYRLAPYLF
ncbi:MAG: isoprenylcysteine carboxylmethyltransferase family protein [Alphaproteobacteria bacterium]|nr:isoprenylcysteine carboxylmethyltransferase family protein [Alphaproteobacteria bacterium]MBU0863932.1 isoprenylcysteine carboxylmethyltransferase family protein [Alphaproteobacteria bacterium]MBU1824562.1 isoprenylcysteine carboxylmethyltransferase family protein [Alphaproteobacteria bacterium]